MRVAERFGCFICICYCYSDMGEWPTRLGFCPNRVWIRICLYFSVGGERVADCARKRRIVVLTGVAPTEIEPGGMESMVRLLAHADLYEIEGLIATGGWNIFGRTYSDEWMEYMQKVINAYEADLPNLMKRSGQKGFLPVEKEAGKQTLGYWPSATYLRSRTAFGSRDLGVTKLGEENSSQGTKMIIELVDEKDDRPVWVMV